MPISVEWDPEDETIIRVTYTGNWTWGDVYVARDTRLKMIDNAPTMVDVIHDMRECDVIPRGAINHVRDLVSKTSTNTGMVVVVGTSKFVQTTYALFNAAYSKVMDPNNFQLVASLEEAYAIIDEARKMRAR